MTTVPLRFVADVRTSSVDKHTHEDELPVTLCNYTDVYRGDRLRPTDELMRATATADEVARFRLQVGDTVLTKDSEDPNDIGISAYIEETADDFVCGYHLAIARPRADVHPRYLTWSLRGRPALDHFAMHSAGISRYGLSQQGLRSTPVWLPDPDSQARIADFLDDRVARINEIIATRRAQATLLPKQTEGELQELSDVLARQHGETRVGRVIAKLEQGWSPQAEGAPADDGEWGVMRSGSVNGGTFRPGDNKRLPPGLQPRREYELRPGDLLMSRASGSLDLIGSVAVVPHGTRSRLLLCDKLYRIAPQRDWSPLFLAGMLRSRSNRERIRLGVSGAEGMANNLPSGLIRDLRVPVAGPIEQAVAVRRIEEGRARESQSVRDLWAAIASLREYKESLITAAVTGELDVTTAGSGVPG